MRSNISVGLPIDLLWYPRDSLRVRHAAAHRARAIPTSPCCATRWGGGPAARVRASCPIPTGWSDYGESRTQVNADERRCRRCGATRAHSAASTSSLIALCVIRVIRASASSLRFSQLASDDPGRAPPPDPLPVRPPGEPVAARGPAAAGGALPHADRRATRCKVAARRSTSSTGSRTPTATGVARARLPGEGARAEITVDLVADMTVINPFDFFVEEYAENFPFAYTPQLARELAPYLERGAARRRCSRRLDRAFARAHGSKPGISTIDFLVALNQQAAARRAVPRAHGAGHPAAGGDARARARLLPRLGLAAGADPAPPRPRGALRLGLPHPAHRRREAARRPGRDRQRTSPTCTPGPRPTCPGAGWIGLDPTSGLLAGEGHIPLACTALPVERRAGHRLHRRRAKSTLDFEMTVTRIHEDPRVTKPYTDAQWRDDRRARARRSTRELADGRRAPHAWAASRPSSRSTTWTARSGTSPRSRRRSAQLAERPAARLRDRFAPGGAAALRPGQVVSGRAAAALGAGLLLAHATACRCGDDADAARASATHGAAHAEARAPLRRASSRARSGSPPTTSIPAYEDPLHAPARRSRPAAERRSARATTSPRTPTSARGCAQLERGIGTPVGFVLPLRARRPRRRRPVGARPPAGQSSPWPLRREHLFLLARRFADGLPPAAGLAAGAAARGRSSRRSRADPFDAPRRARRRASPRRARRATRRRRKAPPGAARGDPAPRSASRRATARCTCSCRRVPHARGLRRRSSPRSRHAAAALGHAGAHRRLPAAATTRACARSRVTPDPGVIEVNIHPALDWDELARHTHRALRGGALSRAWAPRSSCSTAATPAPAAATTSRSAARRRPTARCCAGPTCCAA